MFPPKYHERSPDSPPVEDVTVRSTVFFLMKQVGFLVLAGGLVWFAHMLHQRLSGADMAPHSLPANGPETAGSKATTAPGNGHSSAGSPRNSAGSPSDVKPRWAGSGGDRKPRGPGDGLRARRRSAQDVAGKPTNRRRT